MAASQKNPKFGHTLAAIASGKNQKAPGIDGIPREFLKSLPILLKHLLLFLFLNSVLHFAPYPDSWSMVQLGGILKTVPPTSPNHWRWIGKQSQVAKTYVKTISKAMREGEVRQEMDAIELMGIIFESVFLSSVVGQNLVVLQLDFLTAHDLVTQQAWVCAHTYKKHDTGLVYAMLRLFASTYVQYSLPGLSESEWLQKTIGLIQGDPEASKLFSDYCDMLINPLIQQWTERRWGFRVPDEDDDQ